MQKEKGLALKTNSVLEVQEGAFPGAVVKVPLKNVQEDAEFAGTFYLGEGQPARLVFDTGSEYLAVTSSLCGSAEGSDEKFSGLAQARAKGEEQTAKCLTKAYDLAKATHSEKKGDRPTKVVYGSAELEGVIYQDSVCAVEGLAQCFPL